MTAKDFVSDRNLASLDRQRARAVMVHLNHDGPSLMDPDDCPICQISQRGTSTREQPSGKPL